MTSNEALLDIDQVSQLSGLPQSTLRNWEKRYGFPRPHRSSGGHRLYDIEEVRKIRKVAQLCKNGAKAREMIEQVLQMKDASLESFGPAQLTSPTLSASLDQVLEALYRYDVAAAEEQISRIGMRLSESDLLEMVYPTLLVQVGFDWENGRINIAQEHFSWNFFRTRLLSFFKPSMASSFQPKCILATPPGELHEGGLLVLAAYMMLKGWKVYYLGVSLPIQDLLHATEVIQPDAVCLSAIMAENIRQHWEEIEKLPKMTIIGGPCAHELRVEKPVPSSKIAFVEGDLQSAIAQIELLLQSVAKNL